MPRESAARGAAAALIFLGVGLAVSPGAAQQQPQLTGVVSGEGYTPVRIALPEPAADEAARAVSVEIAETIRDDLRFTGFFDVVDPALYGLVKPATGSAVPHDEWASIGAGTVLLGKLWISSDRLNLEARLYDNPSKSEVFAHRYGEKTDLARRLAHKVADDLVRHFTGRNGVALTRIAFVSVYAKGKELYLVDYDGRRVRRLTTTGTLNLSPAWSPDGERLAFVSWRGGSPGLDILESDGRLTRVATPGGDLNSAPAWSPDGRKLAFTSDAPGNSEIYLHDLATGANTRLTYSPAIETSPSFSPTGREIAFTSDRSGTPQIYVMDAEGLNARRVSTQGDYNESAAWSPQGDRLCYVSRIDGRFDVVVLDLATGALSRLTHGEGNNEDPSWSPDGRHIVFSSSRRRTYDLYTMRADGSDVRQLTTGGNCFTPSWSR